MLIVGISQNKEDDDCSSPSWVNVQEVGAYPDSKWKESYQKAQSLWDGLKAMTTPCKRANDGSPDRVNKFNVFIERYSDDGATRIGYWVWFNGTEVVGVKPVVFGDDPPLTGSNTSTGPSIWGVLAAIGLAGAVGYGAWKITGMIVDEAPSRRKSRP